MADKYFLAKKTDAKITAAQVEKLETVATAAVSASVAGATGSDDDIIDAVVACLVANGLMDDA